MYLLTFQFYVLTGLLTQRNFLLRLTEPFFEMAEKIASRDRVTRVTRVTKITYSITSSFCDPGYLI